MADAEVYTVNPPPMSVTVRTQHRLYMIEPLGLREQGRFGEGATDDELKAVQFLLSRMTVAIMHELEDRHEAKQAAT